MISLDTNAIDQVAVTDNLMAFYRQAAAVVTHAVLANDVSQATIGKPLAQFELIDKAYHAIGKETQANAALLTVLTHEANRHMELVRHHGPWTIVQLRQASFSAAGRLELAYAACTSCDTRIRSVTMLRRDIHAQVRAAIGKASGLEARRRAEQGAGSGGLFMVGYLAGGAVCEVLMNDVSSKVTERIASSFCLSSLWSGLDFPDVFGMHPMARAVGNAVGIGSSQELCGHLQMLFSPGDLPANAPEVATSTGGTETADEDVFYKQIATITRLRPKAA